MPRSKSAGARVTAPAPAPRQPPRRAPARPSPTAPLGPNSEPLLGPAGSVTFARSVALGADNALQLLCRENAASIVGGLDFVTASGTQSPISGPVSGYSMDSDGAALLAAYISGATACSIFSPNGGKSWGEVAGHGPVVSSAAPVASLRTTSATRRGVIAWAGNDGRGSGIYATIGKGAPNGTDLEWGDLDLLSATGVGASFPAAEDDGSIVYVVWRQTAASRGYALYWARWSEQGGWSQPEFLWAGMDPSITVGSTGVYIGYHLPQQEGWVAFLPFDGAKWEHRRVGVVAKFVQVAAHPQSDVVAVTYADYEEHSADKDDSRRRLGAQVSRNNGKDWVEATPAGEEVFQIRGAPWVGADGRVIVGWTDARNGQHQAKAVLLGK